ncbi:MAG: hypothetical protein JO154_22205 [Chitinophaga sp.]|uniref:hypothetical protein n=1 Tax=Chitinophaga sp. TaxID=1869181 RepID=UPI0025B862B0|nr:hypothetical protein [Chitinophaga sp.]MBV8255330.1 hypothetical protein [Chitinophaga sp.]
MIKQMLTTAIGILLSYGTIIAQQPEIALSAGFADPGEEVCKLLLMENGSTMFFHFSPKNGINTTVYDAEHKVVSTVNNQISSFNASRLKNVFFRGMYDMNGQAVLFLVRYQRKSSTLYRFTFNGKTGKLAEEKIVDDVARSPMILGIKGMPDYCVKKDPASGYYAVASLNLNENYGKGQIKVTHYAPDHHVIHQATYTTPEQQFKYLRLKDMYVHGADYVFLTTLGINISFPAHGKVFITRISKEHDTVAEKYVELGKLLAEPLIGIKYNPANQLLYMLTAVGGRNPWQESVMNSAEGGMLLKMHTVNPTTMEISPEASITHPALSTYAKANLKYRDPYRGIIQDFRLHKDGSVTVMQEELHISKDTSARLDEGVEFSGAGSTTFGDIGIFRVNAEGKELPGSYAIAKSQHTHHWINPYLIYRRPEIAWNYYPAVHLAGVYNDNYCSYDYLEANDKSYIVYNDYPININRKTEDHRKKRLLQSLKPANTVLAWFDGEKVQRMYLFGDPEGEHIAQYSRIDMITRGAGDSSFVTLMVERKGSQREAHIAWVKL